MGVRTHWVHLQPVHCPLLCSLHLWLPPGRLVSTTHSTTHTHAHTLTNLLSSISVALVLAAYIATVFLVAYVKGRGLHKLTWGGWSLRSLDNWWLFLKLGLPGFLMLAFEWWTFEISVLVSGSLGKTELGVNAILLQLLSLLFMVSAPTLHTPSHTHPLCSCL